MAGLGIGELLILLAIVMIFFGVGRLDEIGGALGRSIKSFRNAVSDEEEQEQLEQKAE